MGDIINSICFHENKISWLQVEVSIGQSVTVKRVVESPLPFIINFDNVQKSTTALQIANHLNSLAEANELNNQNVRYLLSAKFGLIKKVLADQHIPQSMHMALAKQELQATLPSPIDDYFVYQPEYSREQDALEEILTVAIRKDLFSFFQRIGKEARMPVTEINLNCFSVDELYRRFFPNLIGQTMLVNYTERGYEVVISDERNFLNYYFRPYTKTLQNIDQLDEKDIIDGLIPVVEDIQRPAAVDEPLYSISQIFVFGHYFNPKWLEQIGNRSNLPLKLLNPGESSEWQVISEDEKFNSDGAHRFVEPLSNIF